MDIEYFYKGLPVENEVYGFTLEQSSSKSKCTMYEAWFDVLKASPWYSRMSSGEFPSEQARSTWEGFGDISKITFEDWWKERGYQIFAERVPFRKIQEIELNYKIKTSKGDEKPPVLILEVPLNLHPDLLKKQLDEILARQRYLSGTKRFKRWDHSTADFHLLGDGIHDYNSIKNALALLADFESEKNKPGFQKNLFAQKKGLLRYISPTASLSNQETKALNEKLLYELDQTRNLIANATEGRFPDISPHSWVKELKKES
jgi:hypothetical protein